MYYPKFKIGDIVSSEKYEYKKAIVVGVEAYTKPFILNYPIHLSDWKYKVHGYDYKILILDENSNVLDADTLSEHYLELWEEPV